MIHKGTIVLGVLIGAAAGVLLAPKKGSETRDRLKKEGRDIKAQLSSDLTEVKDDLTKKLKEMHPAKLMNYMMQSLETARNILILKEVLGYLRDKDTKIALYTYDAILFDFSTKDGKETLKGIQKIMESNEKYPVKFKYSKSLNLQD